MRKHQRGMSLAEVLVAIGIVAIIVGFSTTMMSTALRGTQDNINKQFATQKAVSMLEELRALVQTDSGATAVVLDDYDDGTTNRTVLTTRTGVTDPADPGSGNTRVGSEWLYERRISVQRVQGANDVRLVNVKVYVRDVGGLRVLAEVAGILSTIPNNMPPTQVYDVYLLAVENVPGWWVYMQNIRPFVEGAISDLQARHPGLEFRQHWIRKLSYGRDPLYTPWVNADSPSTDPIPQVYFYPGRMPDGSAVENYYSPDYFMGRVRLDNGTLLNGYHATNNPLPYSLADQYNNSMRYPEEKALFDARAGTVISTTADGKQTTLETQDAPTLRLLLDDMVMNPDEYRNAIIINLHGELFPFPPVRNYADAAKNPAVALQRDVRVVTHPERLAYGNADPLVLRVYSYHNNPDAAPPWLDQPITITLKGVVWTPVDSNIQAIKGGVNMDGAGGADEYAVENATSTPYPITAPTRMWWSSATNGTDTVIRLYNSPLRSPCVKSSGTAPECNRGGLAADKRLYGLEYIPAPTENLPDSLSPFPFTYNLANRDDRAKNTARWVITIPAGLLPANTPAHLPVTVETRIGADATTDYPNVSRTYAWRGTDVWLYGDATNHPHLPLTERFQFLGDPRHLPYADLKLPHLGSGLVRGHRLGLGYNRYFDDFHSSGADRDNVWTGWSYEAPPGTWFGVKNHSGDADPHNDNWRTHNDVDGSTTYAAGLEIDAHRIYQVMRTAILRTNSVYTTMTGFSYYYVGIGNEIGYDQANGFPNSIPLSSRPFTGSNGTRYEQSILSDTGVEGVKYIKEDGTDWWAMTWLGELYPDSQWANWSANGNLATGTGAGTFRRVLRGSINTRLPAGTDLIEAARRTQEEGSPTFFWAGSRTSTFHHRPADNTTASLATDGTTVANTYKLPMPGSIANNRPFDLTINDTNVIPDHFLQNVYGPPTTISSLSQFYRHTTNIHGSSLIAMRSGTDAAFVVVNGLSPTGESGVAFIARWSFLSLIQSFLASGRFMTAGQPDPARVRELPRVMITSPGDEDDLVDPDSINVTWEATWRRWDGLAYTPAYPANFVEDTTVRYALLYSRDNGRTWLHMQDGSAATPGKRPANAYLQTGTSYLLSTPAGQFPKGNYVLRVEAYRDKGGKDLPLHYSFHQYRAFIKRSS